MISICTHKKEGNVESDGKKKKKKKKSEKNWGKLEQFLRSNNTPVQDGLPDALVLLKNNILY